MPEIIGVLLGGVLLAFLGFRQGMASEREQSRKIAVEAERNRKDQAAKDAGEAMRSAAAERDAAMKRPAGTVVGDALRRGK